MTITEIGLGILNFIISGACTMLWQKLSKIESTAEKAVTDLADFKLYVAKEHPTQEHFTKAVDGFNTALRDVFGAVNGIKSDIKSMSDTFRDKLETKVDRGHQ